MSEGADGAQPTYFVMQSCGTMPMDEDGVATQILPGEGKEQGEAVTPEEAAPPLAALNLFTKPVPEPAIVIAKPATEPFAKPAAGLTAKPTAKSDAEVSLAILSAPLPPSQVTGAFLRDL
ncbi:hypothetical protein T492DRAFT_861224 [Pavlovales sp. CCMP2436]|nr:hypothetical protein T492DRAFT_861224 [Pavlovales sp. CCMP2436]